MPTKEVEGEVADWSGLNNYWHLMRSVNSRLWIVGQKAILMCPLKLQIALTTLIGGTLAVTKIPCQWLKEGDKNTRFFHLKASQRKKTNWVDSIKDDNNVEYREESHIARIMSDFFITLTGSVGPRKDGIFSVRSGYHFTLNENRNQNVGSNSGRPLPEYQWQKLWRGFSVLHSVLGAWKSQKQRITYSEGAIGSKKLGAPLLLEIKFPRMFTQPIDFEHKDTPLSLQYSKAVDACRTFANIVPPPPADNEALRMRSTCWKPPPTGYFKINIDAALGSGNSWGCGIIIRDSEGNVLAAAAQRFSALPDATVAEAMAAKLGLKFAKDTSFDSVILESDCKIVTDLINSNSTTNLIWDS
ncbi:Ribonuclease H-like superfamily [Sesbania bispinosa]|nr:Ribonuclease H-like superfamily [Sesbania bispinosa]